jgi:hypothetical protein
MASEHPAYYSYSLNSGQIKIPFDKQINFESIHVLFLNETSMTLFTQLFVREICRKCLPIWSLLSNDISRDFMFWEY